MSYTPRGFGRAVRKRIERKTKDNIRQWSRWTKAYLTRFKGTYPKATAK